jgi:hypothetical protein
MRTDWLTPYLPSPLQPLVEWGAAQAGLWAAAAAALATVLWWALRHASHKEPAEPLTLAWSPRSDQALSKAEVATYFRLREALPQHIILAQVQLSRFLKVSTRLSYSGWMRRVGARCVDFVVCDAAGMVVAVIELEPEPIGGTMGPNAARRKHKVLKAAEIPVMYWDAAHLPTAAQIRAMMMAAESGRMLNPLEPTAAPVGMARGAYRDMPALAQREDRFGLVGRRG